MRRSMTLLNELGDSTIMWTEEHDEFWVAAIQAMMNRGVTFFIIDERNLRRPLTRAPDARTTRNIAMMDSPGAEVGVKLLQIPGEPEASQLIEEGKAEVVKTPAGAVKTRRRAKTAKEVASAQTVGVRQRKGG